VRPPLVLVLVLAGCASSGATSGGASPSTRCWPIAPLELQALEHGREWEPMSRLAADGTISNRVGTLGRIAGDTFMMGAGTVVISGTCADRRATLGSPLSPALKMVATYDARDVFIEEGGYGARIAVADDGIVEMTMHAQPVFGRPGSGAGVVRVVGDVRAARRTAALLVFTTAALGAGR
jgi:hypothetical protein